MRSLCLAWELVFPLARVMRVPMERMCHRAIAILLLGGYSLAVTVGGAFHTHLGGDCCTEESKPADACHSHVCHAGNAHATPAKSPALETVAIPCDSHCPICSFLSQKPIPVAVQGREDSTELGQPLIRVRSIPPSDDIPSTVFGRGPPTIA